MSYYVYGTFVERERIKFETKEEALAFSKWANKEINTSFDWIFNRPDPYKAREAGFDPNKFEENQGFWYACTRSRASQWKSISKPIKSYSFWNRLKNQFWFILDINKIDHWTDDTPLKP